ncbi:unnamed protein product [Miscanthus lutarioriparius]|uniref:AMP-dependent synthetase/ligase domain-containing protein n=1 Tax=Miscanthus lutarioriparius TaxID=422564 RepID=A0A811RSG7_9POAL|nr:unnamed protein product [Miscanthus lutarioriparius]
MCTENYDACYPDQPVVDRYLPVWAKLPAFAAKPAFIWADDDAASTRTALTYAQLDAAVGRMARNLLGTVGSLRRGDAVLVLASPGLRLVKLHFACQRAGLTAVPVVPPDPAGFGTGGGPAHAHLLRAVSQARPTPAVADAGYTSMPSPRWLLLPSPGPRETTPGAGWLPCWGACAGWPSTSWSGSGSAAVMGRKRLHIWSDGRPEARGDHCSLGGPQRADREEVRRPAPEQRHRAVAAPQFHDCGLVFLLLTVVAGATCVLAATGAFLWHPRLWLELVSEFGATCTPVPSFALPLVLRRGRGHPRPRRRPLQLGSLRNLILINEPIYKSCVDEFMEAFCSHGLRSTSVSPSYGLAENCIFVSTAWQTSESSSSHLPSYMRLLPSARLSPPPSSAANEVPEIEIAVVDEDTGEPVEDGVEGEIWVSSPSNASGYLGHPSASREVFCARVPGRAGACFVRTGDRGVVTGAERYLYVVGRSADVITLDDDCGGGRRRVHAHYVETAAFGSSPNRLRGGCVSAFATLSIDAVVTFADRRRGRRRGAAEGKRRWWRSQWPV